MIGLNMSIQITISDTDKETVRYNDPINLTPEQELEMLVMYMKNALVTIARDVLKEEQQKGFDLKPIVAVDNVIGRKEEDVKPFGLIQYNSAVATFDLLVPLYQGLIQRSKVDTGLYQDSHFVFFRGVLVATNVQELINWTKSGPDIREGARIRFVNVMPYASKLEREGITSGRSQLVRIKAKDKRKRSGAKVRRPNGAYYLTAKSLDRKYGNNAQINFEWINGRALKLQGVPTSSRSGKPLRTTFAPSSQRKGYYVYPSITVTITSGGGVK